MESKRVFFVAHLNFENIAISSEKSPRENNPPRFGLDGIGSNDVSENVENKGGWRDGI